MTTPQPFDRLTRQTAAFLAAAGIPHDRLADHDSAEWKLFIAGYECAERAAGTVRIPLVRAAAPAAASPAPAAALTDEQIDHLFESVTTYQPEGDDRPTILAFARAIEREARAALAGAPVADTAPKWISVDERLPECNMKPGTLGVEVLIYPPFERGERTAMFGCRVTDNASFYKYGTTLGSITHWMPLPAAPGEAQ